MTTKTKTKTARKTTARKTKVKAPTASQLEAKGRSAKLTPQQADRIKSSRAMANDTSKHVVIASDGRQLTFPTARWAGELRDMSGVGKSFAALEKRWAELSAAKLARGVESRSAPHSAKAIADNKATKAKSAKPAKTSTAKARKATAKAKADESFSKAIITVTEKGQAQLEAGKDNGSTRNLAKLAKAGNVAKAMELGLKTADINYAKKVGTITVK